MLVLFDNLILLLRGLNLLVTLTICKNLYNPPYNLLTSGNILEGGSKNTDLK